MCQAHKDRDLRYSQNTCDFCLCVESVRDPYVVSFICSGIQNGGQIADDIWEDIYDGDKKPPFNGIKIGVQIADGILRFNLPKNLPKHAVESMDSLNFQLRIHYRLVLLQYCTSCQKSGTKSDKRPIAMTLFWKDTYIILKNKCLKIWFIWYKPCYP